MSEAIVSKHSYSLPDEKLREDVEFSLQDATINQPDTGLPLDDQDAVKKAGQGD